MPVTINPDDLKHIQIAVIKLEKDMEVMTASVTKIAVSMEKLAETHYEVRQVTKSQEKLESSVNTLFKLVRALETKSNKNTWVSNAIIALVYLAAGAALNHFFEVL